MSGMISAISARLEVVDRARLRLVMPGLCRDFPASAEGAARAAGWVRRHAGSAPVDLEAPFADMAGAMTLAQKIQRAAMAAASGAR